MPASQPIPRDVAEFLDGYPDVREDKSISVNLQFYSNELPCRPDNMLIDEVHEHWMGQYDLLEQQHGFIQWLFPIREHGMNYQSVPLQTHEITAMRASDRIVERVLQSYRLMLDFYGMRLCDPTTGLVDCSLPPRNHASRYRNLVRSSHNYLRISRILKSLSELGLEHLNAGFLLHVLAEQSENNQLNTPGIISSMDRWWANCIRNEEEREWVGAMIHRARTGQEVFTRTAYESALLRRKETGSLKGGQH